MRNIPRAWRLIFHVALAALWLSSAIAGESDLARKAHKMLAENPTDTQVINQAAQILYKEGIHDEAIAVWQKLMKLRPTMAEPHYFVGMAYFDRVQNEDAVAEFRKAIELKSNYAEAHYQLGTVLRELGDDEGAIREYEEAIRINPSFLEVHDSLGRVLHDKGRVDEAIQAYKEEIRLEPRGAETYFNLGSALKDKGRYDEAIRAFEEFIRSTPSRDNEEEIERAQQMIEETRQKKALSLAAAAEE